MRCFELVLLFAVIATVCTAEPEPKKYKPEVKTKVKDNSTLSDEERQFLREVETKFGIKSEVPVNNQENDESKKDSEEEDDKPPPLPGKLPFPAVIAIEIVNDTDSKEPTKGKRTIDANLGYGYRTNNGYTYSYFGKSGENKGKFMIYPYSQEDIPSVNPTADSPAGYHQQQGKTTKLSPNVEIVPSQAFELVPAKEQEEQTSYNYEKPAVQLKTKYENIHTVESPPPLYPDSNSSPPATLYSTYNGEQFSGLSGQFPKVMSNYLVDPSQLLNNPSYQSAGLTQEHLRPHGNSIEQRVVPVLVLRIPSSYIKDPSAELYANLPQNYPLSQYLNHVNLQELVNNYFKKIGFPYAPKVMTYPSAPQPTQTERAPSVSNYQPQHYASPYVQPSYSHADYSGVQYSAVQPVMAKYPSGYTRQNYYVMHPQPQSLYQQPLQQQYVYRYRYVSGNPSQSQSYYTQPQYEQQHQPEYEQQHQPNYEQQQQNQPQYEQQQQQQLQPEYEQQQQHQPNYEQQQQNQPQYEQQHQIQYQQHQAQPQYDHQEGQESHRPSSYDTSGLSEYGHRQTSAEGEQVSRDEYANTHSESAQEYEPQQKVTSSYETVTSASPSYENVEHSTPGSEYLHTQSPSHGSSPSVQVEYDNSVPKESISVFPRSQSGHKAGIQSYLYQNIHNDHSGSESLVLTENYPSKDHTIATVLPLSYKNKQHSEPVQAVSYVTPMPTMKYHSHYRVMVPQTVFKRPTSEKVAYVNSHSLTSPYSQLAALSNYNPEGEFTDNHYVSSLAKQKTSSYPRSYSAHLKRMAKPENKSDSSSTRKSDKSDKKKSS